MSNNEDDFFANDVGVISENEVIIFRYSTFTPIKITDIRKIFVEKKRFYGVNSIFLLFSLYFFYSVSKSVYIENNFNLFLLTNAVLFLIISYSIQMHVYKMIILTENDFIVLNYNKKEKDQIKDFVKCLVKEVYVKNK